MRIYIKLQFCLLVLFTVSSCEKYLDKRADKSAVVPTTIGDLQAILDDTQAMNFYTPAYGTASADDHFLLKSAYDGRSLRDQNTYIWQPTEGNFVNDYAGSYIAIYNTNLSLEQIQKIEKTSTNEALWNNVKGSALFFRCYYFLHLAWVYAKTYDEESAGTDLGIIMRLGSDFNVPSRRSNVKETYEKIINDLKEAILMLPDHAVIATRPSKAAACALLARAYLSMRDYDNCLNYADLSLKINGQLMDYNNSSEVNLAGTLTFTQLNKETVFFTRMSTDFGSINPTYSLADTILYGSYNNDDLRKLAFFRNNGLYKRFKGSYTGSSLNFSGITTAEMYLTRAECNARKGNVEAAMADLNTLMKKRWKNTVPYPTFTAANANDALTKILTERRKELLFRGLRWMDIKRLNKEGANIVLKRVINNQTYTLQPNDSRYALPLPSDIIRLTGVPQN